MEKPDIFAMIVNGADDIIRQFDELNTIMESGMYDLMVKSEQSELIRNLTSVLHMIPAELAEQKMIEDLS
jgi:hypothetical protein